MPNEVCDKISWFASSTARHRVDGLTRGSSDLKTVITGIVMETEMDLKIMASVVFWEARRVFLTDTELVLSKAAEPALVSASILLHDILNVFEDKQHAEEGAEGEHVLVLRTDACSASFGRTHILRMHDSEKFNEWFR